MLGKPRIVRLFLSLFSKISIIHEDSCKILSIYFQALVLCFRLHFTKDSTTINTAAATIKQLVSIVFERVITEDKIQSQGKMFSARVLIFDTIQLSMKFIMLIKVKCQHLLASYVQHLRVRKQEKPLFFSILVL